MFLIKPLKEIVFDPETQKPMSADGIKVESVSTFWFRRELDGDVSIKEFETKVASLAAEKPESKKKGVN